MNIFQENATWKLHNLEITNFSEKYHVLYSETNLFFQEITVIQRYYDSRINILFFLEPTFTETLLKLHKVTVYIIKTPMKRKKPSKWEVPCSFIKSYLWSQPMKFLNYCIFSLVFFCLSLRLRLFEGHLVLIH